MPTMAYSSAASRQEEGRASCENLTAAADEAINAVVQQAGFDRRRVLSGLPHPSGANAERIAFFLGRKHREDLSTKVDPEKLITARAGLVGKISALVSITG